MADPTYQLQQQFQQQQQQLQQQQQQLQMFSNQLMNLQQPNISNLKIEPSQVQAAQQQLQQQVQQQMQQMGTNYYPPPINFNQSRMMYPPQPPTPAPGPYRPVQNSPTSHGEMSVLAVI